MPNLKWQNRIIAKRMQSYVFPSKKSRNVSLPLDIMLKLFSVIVKPVVLYGAEV